MSVAAFDTTPASWLASLYTNRQSSLLASSTVDGAAAAAAAMSITTHSALDVMVDVDEVLLLVSTISSDAVENIAGCDDWRHNNHNDSS